MLINRNRLISLIKGHPYHIVDMSPWPITTSISLYISLIGLVMKLYNYKYGNIIFLIGLILLIIIINIWLKDIIRESTYQGYHNLTVEKSLKIGFILFIISEIFLFISLFWAYLHSGLSPNIEIGSIWPPRNIEILNPWSIPLLNGIILLSSGVTATWAHNSVIISGTYGYKNTVKGLIITIILGLIFVLFQMFEFYNAPFSMSDGIYGTTFFFTSGAHGLHVIVGLLFILVALFRIKSFTYHHHLGLEISLWYWHVVDCIYLFLFIIVYLWGNSI